MKIPFTKKEKLTEVVAGISVEDSFRWLENSVDPEVEKWVNEQNTYAKSVINSDHATFFSKKLTNNFETTNFTVPVAVRGKYLFTERKPGDNHRVLYMKEGLEGKPIALVNPNELNSGGSISLSYWEESCTGKYVAYGLDEKGSEMATMYVKDCHKNENLPDVIVNCRYSSICWLPDDSGFYYTRNPRPNTVPKNEEHLHAKVYLHILGTDPEKDELIFGENRPKEDKISLQLSPDREYLAISVSQNWVQNDIYIFSTKSKKIVPMIVDLPYEFFIRFSENRVFLHTNYMADNFHVLSVPIADLFDSLSEWDDLIPEDDFLLESIQISQDTLLAEYLVNACSQVKMFDFSGAVCGELPLPPLSSITVILARSDEKEFFFGVESFTFPHVIYRFDSLSKTFPLYRKTENLIDPNDYEVKQEWFESRDKTSVPLFILHKKGLVKNGVNPTILYGYGGFGTSETPSFRSTWFPWLEQNGIFAIANIRGGGEFGKNWHKQGIKEFKQNSFDDFTAAAQFLISQKYTSTQHLGILGASNGGLLVSAVAVQHPDLFKAVCSRVPLTDMVRFPQFGIASRWVHEYGDPKDKSDLERIIKWSPYHTVKSTVTYPHFLFTTADKDSRVDPLHARKMTAALQSAHKENQVLLLTEKDAGHGMGKPIFKIVEIQSMILSFFAKELGLKI